MINSNRDISLFNINLKQIVLKNIKITIKIKINKFI